VFDLWDATTSENPNQIVAVPFIVYAEHCQQERYLLGVWFVDVILHPLQLSDNGDSLFWRGHLEWVRPAIWHEPLNNRLTIFSS
jgi:hypothetical protein